ncbi:MAG: response regulator [Chloroflexi bacterium]|nr:response regulator [Chloroflexota bacterium]
MLEQNGTTILYVEDNPENRILIQRVLMAEGYQVLFAENADQALAAAQGSRLDLILMDINLPDVDGYTLTSRLRQLPRLSAVPILALTANVMRGDRERSLEAGCDGYIQKPIDVDALPRQIESYLKK